MKQRKNVFLLASGKTVHQICDVIININDVSVSNQASSLTNLALLTCKKTVISNQIKSKSVFYCDLGLGVMCRAKESAKPPWIYVHCISMPGRFTLLHNALFKHVCLAQKKMYTRIVIVLFAIYYSVF